MSNKLKKNRHNPLGDDIQRDREPFDFARKKVRTKARDARKAATLARVRTLKNSK
jgi:hypothetical protein